MSSASSVTNPQDGGGPAGLSPAGELQSLACSKFLQPCADQIGNEAVGAAAAAGVAPNGQHRSMAELAARKKYASPTSSTPGGPPPSMAPRQQQQYPVQAPMPQHQVPMVPAPQETIAQQMERMGAPGQVKKNMRKITFSLVREGTLDQLANGTLEPGKSYSIMNPADGERAVVTNVRLTRVSSSCPQSIGVNFDRLTPKYRVSRPGSQRGCEYHAAAPRGGMPAETDVKEVFRLGSMANPEHLLNYGALDSIQKVEDEIEPSKTGLHNVFLNGTVLGGIIQKNNPPGVMVRKTDDGKLFVQMKRAKLDEYVGEVKKLIDSPEFQRCLTDLSDFNMTLVPLNESGQWDDVSEWRHMTSEQQQKQKREMSKAPFTVHVEGEMDIMLLKKNQ